MPRGRHRHSPPLHRLLPPSTIAGVSLVCALGPWLFTTPAPLRALATVAAVTAVAGACVMRRWDTQAGRQVADLTRARASDEWHFEERLAELESDLDEARELRVRLEQKLRDKRAELAGLRNEHAALLRRYATAETERASALEGRRLLEVEAGGEVPALPAAPAVPARTEDADTGAARNGAAQTGPAAEKPAVEKPAEEKPAVEKPAEEKPAGLVLGLLSPEGARLFLRADAALARLTTGTPTATGAAMERAGEDEPLGKPEAAGAHEHAAAGSDVTAATGSPAATQPPTATQSTDAEPTGAEFTNATDAVRATEPAGPAATSAPTGPSASAPGRPTPQSAGHFTVPTAVAVVPPTPARRQVAEGGFDFFGTKKEAPSAAPEPGQNQDLADVVGQEARAVHESESESQYEPAGGQVIDLTAHDETERIDLKGLRTAAS